jgi:hypothetical protein
MLSGSSPLGKMKVDNDTKHASVSNGHFADTKLKYRTARAAAPFRTPLSGGILSNADRTVKFTPTIQALECKLQTLRRATRIQKDKGIGIGFSHQTMG